MTQTNFTSNGTGREAFDDLKFSHVYTFSGTAPYARFVDTNTGLIWDDTNTAMAASPTWTDTDVPLLDKLATVGGWKIIVPATLPDGVYDVLIYDTSAAAAYAIPTIGKQMLIKGQQIYVMQVK